MLEQQSWRAIPTLSGIQLLVWTLWRTEYLCQHQEIYHTATSRHLMSWLEMKHSPVVYTCWNYIPRKVNVQQRKPMQFSITDFHELGWQWSVHLEFCLQDSISWGEGWCWALTYLPQTSDQLRDTYPGRTRVHELQISLIECWKKKLTQCSTLHNATLFILCSKQPVNKIQIGILTLTSHWM